jgi:hypothetical protein
VRPPEERTKKNTSSQSPQGGFFVFHLGERWGEQDRTGPLIGDKAEQAYRRSDALDKRRRLMDAWAAYCEPSNSNNIAQLANRKR